MANNEEGEPSKSEKSPSPAQPDQTNQASQTNIQTYPDWAAMQAYYGPRVTIPPYYNSTMASGHPSHPYIWGPTQPMMPPYGAPYAAIYPHGGVYAHPGVPLIPMAYSRFERVCDLLRRADSTFRREMNEWGLGCVFYYMDNFKVEESMLRVAAKFWDHKKHVFRFNWSEMCPTVEEFGAIMGNKNMESVLFSAYHFDPIKILCNYLDHPLKDLNEVIDKDLTFDLELLIDLYWRDNCPSDKRFWSMRVMILVAFFFVSDLEKVDSKLCGVAVEGKDKNLAPMILAETLMGLDKVAKGETQDFTGSPLLLQMWLYEHLYLFGRCPRDKLDVSIPARIHQRHQHAFPRSPDELEEKLSNVRHMELGVVPHWGINCMTQSFLKEGCVVVIGLHRSTFYPAYRVLYQFGRDQTKPIFPLDYTDEDYGGQNPISLDEAWKKRRMMTATDDFKSRMMLPSYLEWLKSDVIPGYPHDAKAKEEARKRCNVEIRNLDECNSEGEWAPPSSDEEEEE